MPAVWVTQAERHEPACRVAHNLVNTLSAIIGHCHLLNEKIEQGRRSRGGSPRFTTWPSQQSNN